MLEHLHSILQIIRYLCYTVLCGFSVYVIYKRLSKKVISYQEIKQWFDSTGVPGDTCHIYRMSSLPEEEQKRIRRELGFQQIINGFKFDTSLVATIKNGKGQIKDYHYFMGKELDGALIAKLANEGVCQIMFSPFNALKLQELINASSHSLSEEIDFNDDIVGWINSHHESLISKGSVSVNVIKGDELAKYITKNQDRYSERLSQDELKILSNSVICAALNYERDIVCSHLIRSEKGLSRLSNNEFKGEPQCVITL